LNNNYPKKKANLKELIEFLNSCSELNQEERVRIINFKPKNKLELSVLIDNLTKLSEKEQEYIFKAYS
jgi:hypothetical protein